MAADVGVMEQIDQEPRVFASDDEPDLLDHPGGKRFRDSVSPLAARFRVFRGLIADDGAALPDLV
jgi:hypothetical protein